MLVRTARLRDSGCATGWVAATPTAPVLFPDRSESISMLAQSFCFLLPPILFLGPAGISCVGLSHPPPVCPGLSYQGACRVGLTHVIPLVGTLVALETGLYPAGGPQLPTPTWCRPHNIRLAAFLSKPLPVGPVLGDPPVFMQNSQPPRSAAAGTHKDGRQTLRPEG